MSGPYVRTVTIPRPIDNGGGYRTRHDFFKDVWKNSEKMQTVMTEQREIARLISQRQVEHQIRSQLSPGQKVNIQLGSYDSATQRFDEVRVWEPGTTVMLADSPDSVRTSVTGSEGNGLPESFQTCPATPTAPVGNVRITQGFATPTDIPVEGVSNPSSLEKPTSSKSAEAAPDAGVPAERIPRPADIPPSAQPPDAKQAEPLRVIHLSTETNEQEASERNDASEKQSTGALP